MKSEPSSPNDSDNPSLDLSNRGQRVKTETLLSSSLNVSDRGTIKQRRGFWSSSRKVIGVFLPLIVLSILNYGFGYKGVKGVTKSFEEAYKNDDIIKPGKQNIREAEEQEELGPEKTDKEPMNIVLFYADDWTMKVLGKLNPYVKTPNIDRMADNGVLFTNSFVTTSICWISRATMVSGLYSAQHRQVRIGAMALFNSSHYSWNQTLFPLLKSAGYYTGLMGKWHAPLPMPNRLAAFDFGRFYYGRHWYVDKATNVSTHVTDLNREDSLEFLRKRPKDKPFALTVSFFATHAEDGNPIRKYNPTNGTLARYPEENTIPIPKTNTDKHWDDLPYFFTEKNVARIRWKKRWQPEYFQSNIRDLYAMASHVDDAVGEIIQELKNQGVYNNTLLIFTTDNGDLHGHHGMAEKWYSWEESIRVPLVIQDPRMAKEKRGTFLDDFVLSVDLAPTILGAAGVPIPSIMQGRDMAELYLPQADATTTQTRRRTTVDPAEYVTFRAKSIRTANHTGHHAANTSTTTTAAASTSSWRQDFFYEFNMGHPYTAENHASDQNYKDGLVWNPAVFALVTKKYKYVYWPQHQYEQIYDLETDPYEEIDRMYHPEKNSTKNGEHLQRDIKYITVTDEVYTELKARYDYLKKWAQEGNKV